MNHFLLRARYAIRLLVKNPGFTFVAVASIALGVGANATIFSIANALLLRPLPIHAPEDVVNIFAGGETSSYVEYTHYRDNNDVLSGLLAQAIVWVNLEAGGPPERVMGQIVTGNYFSVLGVTPSPGRAFLPDEDTTPQLRPVVVLSHAFWQRRFNGDPGVVGRNLTLNGRSFTVIGIAPKGFNGTIEPYGPALWAPMMMQADIWPGGDRLTDKAASGLSLIGRLKPDVEPARVRAVFEAMTRQLDPDPATWSKATRGFIVVEPAGSIYFRIRQAVVGTFVVLFAVVVLLLLIACSNVAGLLAARAADRKKELAIRLALGATRGQVLMQLLTENVLLWIIGGVAGLGAAFVATRLIVAFMPALPVPIVLNLTLDSSVVGFTMLLALATGLVFGLAPAASASKPLTNALKEEVVRIGRSRLTLRQMFVVAQAAVSFVLLIGAGLFIVSLRNAASIDPGFATDHGVVTTVALSTSSYSDAQKRNYYDELVRQTAAIPGIESASLAVMIPLSLERHAQQVIVDPKSPPTKAIPYNVVGPGYFQTMRMPVLRGRGITEQDREGTPLVVVINETMARRFWPGQDPLGQRIEQWGKSREIVGIVRDAKYRTLGEAPEPFLFLPFLQQFEPDMNLHVRTIGDPASVLPAVRAAAQSIDVGLAVETKLLSDHLGIAFLLPRVGATLLSGFGLLGLVLACLGLFGVVSSYVNQRQREIGIRIAVGATRGAIVRQVLVRGLSLTGIGIGVGLLGALVFARLLSTFLYGVSPVDPTVFATTAGVLMMAAAAACLLPARRASRLDPVVALRQD